jgi:hypothetical protein
LDVTGLGFGVACAKPVSAERNRLLIVVSQKNHLDHA